MWLAGKAPTKLFYMSGSPIPFRAFSFWKLLIPLLIFFFNQISSQLLFFSILDSVVGNVWFERCFKVFVFNFWCPEFIQFWCVFDPLVHQFSPSSEFSAFAPTPIPLFSKPVDVRALVPRFLMFPKILPSFCVLRFLCLIGPVCRVLVIVTFLGSFFCSPFRI